MMVTKKRPSDFVALISLAAILIAIAIVGTFLLIVLDALGSLVIDRLAGRI